MTNIRLLPVVILVISAVLVLKTVGLVTNGAYVLTGVSVAQAAGGGTPAPEPAAAPANTMSDPTIADQTPTMSDVAPTMGEGKSAAGGHGEEASASDDHDSEEAHGGPVGNVIAADNACAPRRVGDETESTENGELVAIPGDCPPLKDALPLLVTDQGPVPLTSTESSATEQVLNDRLAARRTDLDAYAEELAMRAALVEAAEKRIEERASTLEAIEAQIAALVEERKRMEENQFAELVAMYSNMKPKDAAAIFNELDINILVRVAKQITPRKMSPILAAMNVARAQELTVRLASLDGESVETMSSSDLAALPQIVGQ